MPQFDFAEFPRQPEDELTRFEAWIMDLIVQSEAAGPPGPQGPPGDDGDTGPQGPAGPTGADGDDGLDGATWRNGSGAPSNSLGADGDYYLDDATGDVYKRAAGVYSIVANIRGLTGATGADGADGADGSDGATGATGATGAQGGPGGESMEFTYDGAHTDDSAPGANKLKFNDSDPASAGVMYVDTRRTGGSGIGDWIDSFDGSSNIFQGVIRLFKKTDPNVWAEWHLNSITTEDSTYRNLSLDFIAQAGTFTNNDVVVFSYARPGDKGDTGATGATGAAGDDGADGAPGSPGADGKTWYSGSGAPSGATGVNGDHYFRTDTSDVYLKSGGSWAIESNIKGSTGATGPTGDTGATGDTGPTGPVGPNPTLTSTADETIAAGTGLYFPGYHEIGNGFNCEIADTAYMEIG